MLELLKFALSHVVARRIRRFTFVETPEVCLFSANSCVPHLRGSQLGWFCPHPLPQEVTDSVWGHFRVS